GSVILPSALATRTGPIHTRWDLLEASHRSAAGSGVISTRCPFPFCQSAPGNSSPYRMSLRFLEQDIRYMMVVGSRRAYVLAHEGVATVMNMLVLYQMLYCNTTPLSLLCDLP